MHRVRTIDGIWFGIVASIVIHLAAVGAVWRTSPGRPSVAPAPSHHEMDLVRLGLERSDHATINWLGFADPTPHRAMPSEVEQAALSRAPLGVPTPGTTSRQPEKTTEQQSEPRQPTRPSPETSKSRPEPIHNLAGPPVPEPTPDDPWQTKPTPEGFLPPPGETPRAVERTPKEQQKPDESTPRKPSTPSPPRTPDTAPPPQGADDLPGRPSDRESTPTAKLPALTLKDWGKPAAGQGIEVRPRRPRWGPTVYSLAWPRNPTVIIEFGRDGHVRRARFARIDGKTRNTGSPEVDRILINTIYNWTARGERIDALAPHGPGSRLAIMMDIKLRW